MFDHIIKLIEINNFESADTQLQSLVHDNDPKTVARANYLLGYIHTCRENKDKKAILAKRYLLNNLSSEFPRAYAYVLYAKLEEDRNTALNYLKKGVSSFPNDPRIYLELFQQSQDKDRIVEIIQNEEFSDYYLLKAVIEYLIRKNDWEKTERFILRMQNNDIISEPERVYLDTLRAYSLLFRNEPVYTKAKDILNDVIEKDINNDLCYSHYLGIIYALLKMGDIGEATRYFDMLPLNNTIQDLTIGPWCIICVEFDKEYKTIFDDIVKSYAKDAIRREKAKCLYALYLYYPSVVYDLYRYRKVDVTVLKRYIKDKFDKTIATALFNMLCKYKLYTEANDVFLQFLINYKKPDEEFIYYSNIVDNISNDDLQLVVCKICELVNRDDNFDAGTFSKTAFKELVEKLNELKQYSNIVSLANILSLKEILGSECAFECAYSYAKQNNTRAQEIYENLKLIEPENCSVMNNLGVLYEKKSALEEAKRCFENAHNLSPEDDIYRANLDRVRNQLKEIAEKKRVQKRKEISAISKDISLEFFESIGYTNEFINLFHSIEDSDFRDILLRDLKECAVSIATGQDKSATIMCGSIIEALLLNKIAKNGISEYDISELRKGNKAQQYPVMDMGLNEMLFVADKENFICKNNYHLSHYVRDYRNFVHPAKEMRTKQSISHENALIMWSVLKQIIYEVLS